jgi:predicted amidohydrolase
MFTTGFTMNTSLAETMDGPTVQWMKQQAGTIDAAMYGSVIISDGQRTYNRGLFVTPDGSVKHYDKRHLFRMAEEIRHFAPGRERVVVEWRGWRVLLQICYDLRFPVFARNRSDYDLSIYVANWPEARRYPWSQLLIARAIENQCYVLGANRVGMDGMGHHYTGDSAVVDPRGEVMNVASGREVVLSSTLNAEALLDFRAKFPVGSDADAFELRF